MGQQQLSIWHCNDCKLNCFFFFFFFSQNNYVEFTFQIIIQEFNNQFLFSHYYKHLNIWKVLSDVPERFVSFFLEVFFFFLKKKKKKKFWKKATAIGGRISKSSKHFKLAINPDVGFAVWRCRPQIPYYFFFFFFFLKKKKKKKKKNLKKIEKKKKNEKKRFGYRRWMFWQT